MVIAIGVLSVPYLNTFRLVVVAGDGNGQDPSVGKSSTGQRQQHQQCSDAITTRSASANACLPGDLPGDRRAVATPEQPPAARATAAATTAAGAATATATTATAAAGRSGGGATEGTATTATAASSAATAAAAAGGAGGASVFTDGALPLLSCPYYHTLIIIPSNYRTYPKCNTHVLT